MTENKKQPTILILIVGCFFVIFFVCKQRKRGFIFFRYNQNVRGINVECLSFPHKRKKETNIKSTQFRYSGSRIPFLRLKNAKNHRMKIFTLWKRLQNIDISSLVNV